MPWNSDYPEPKLNVQGDTGKHPGVPPLLCCLFHGFLCLGVAPLFEKGQGEVLPGRSKVRLVRDERTARLLALLVVALHEVGNGLVVARLHKLGLPLECLGKVLQCLVWLAALQMHKGNVALGNGKLGTEGGSFRVVVEAAFKVAPLQADAAELHHGLGHVRRFSQGIAESALCAHKVALAQKGKAKVVVVCGAGTIGFGNGVLKVCDIFVDVVVLVFHGKTLGGELKSPYLLVYGDAYFGMVSRWGFTWPSRRRRSAYHRQKSKVPRMVSSRLTMPKAACKAPLPYSLL